MLGFAAKRKWIYPQAVTGPWTRLRWWTFAALQGILFLTPWITVGGAPAVLVDLPGRRLYALGAIFTAPDTILLLLLLLLLAFALFFFTALYGRLWCGFACPQTVFLDSLIRPLEHWIEGDWVARRRRDEGPWCWEKIWRKAAKWGLFLALSLVISMTFGSYFAGARELWSGRGSSLEYTIVGLFAALWFFDLAWFREQFCNYLCPYARFQSALTDQDTLLVQYDVARGEPRGGAGAREAGRCIACNKCVFVCPQGIDIRDGFQLECIACARCIDACALVMGKLGHRSLIAFDSARPAAARRLLRPRTVVYGGLLAGLAVAIGTLVVTRAPFDAAVSRAPGTLFTEDADGWVRNTYLLRITNKQPGRERVPFRVRVGGLDQAQVVVQDLELGASESRTEPLVIRVPAKAELPRTVPIQVFVSTPGHVVALDATFKTGGPLALNP